ncbi:hypothetical protein U91I_02372 [alpha proteobacterium U9-1i]|nr:hypothetical protein U91I_02372 [alpha proteobacterium U9-1i]
MVVTLLLPLGWVPLEWMMWLLFPLVLVFFVILLVIPGTRGDNKYGPPDAKLD